MSFFLWRNNPCYARATLSGLHDRTRTHHTRQVSPGQVICSSQRPVRASTLHSQEIFMPLAGFEPAIPASERAANPYFIPCGHWDRPKVYQNYLFNSLIGQNGVMNSTKLNKAKVRPC